MAGKSTASKVKDIELTVGEKAILLWKANGPLSDVEHEQLSSKLRYEQEQSGVTIVLIPYSVSVEAPELEVVTPGGEDNDK